MAWHTEFINELFDSKSLRRILVATAAACAFYPTYFFLVYMADRGFYAFEAFGNVLGVVIPFLFMGFIFGVLLLMLAFFFWGGPMLLLTTLLGTPAAELDIKRELLNALPMSAVNLGLLAMVIWAKASDQTTGDLFLGFALSAGVLAILLVLFSITTKENRASLAIVLAGIALFVPLFARELVQSSVESTLRQFRLGGVAVTLVSGERAPEIAYLVFLSPSNAYLEIGCPPKSVILPRSGGLRFEFTANRMPGEVKCTEPPDDDA